MEKIRLQKYLAERGVASRRASEKLIEEGKVKVNGERVEVGVKIDPQRDKVSVHGKLLDVSEEKEKVYLMLNKPVGYVTTVRDEQGRKTVMELVAQANEKGGRIYPVGRLDIETSGLLLMTNDGAWAQKVIHPSAENWKVYVAVTGGGEWTETEISRFKSGLQLGKRAEKLTAPAEIRILERRMDGTKKVEIKVLEGQNHQVRRMCSAVNHPVLRLERTAIGKLKLGELRRGQWRWLKPNEISFFK